MWITKEYEDNNLDDLLELERDNYGDICIADEKYLKWQYYLNPSGKAVIKLANDSEKNILAGEYIVIPMKLKVEDKVVIGTLSLNTLTRKEYRGQGIFTGLANGVYKECSNKGLAFTYGFPNQNSYPGFIKKLEFKELGQVPLVIKPLNYKVIVEKKINKYLSKLVPSFNSYKRYNDKNKNKDFNVYAIDEDNVKDIDVLWDKIKDSFKVIGVRDSQYIKWRYINIPLRKYKILALKKDNEILGYIVGNFRDVDGINSGMIVDFIFDHNHPKAGNILVNALMKYFKSENVHMVGSLLMSNSAEYKVLKNNGFYRCPKFLEPQPFPFIYRAHTSDGEDSCMYNFDNWFLTMGDYDVI